MNFYLNLFLFCVFVITSADAQAKKIPTNKDIEDYDDPVLREIFQKKIPPSPELMANNGGYYPQQSGGGTAYQGQRTQPYSPTSQGFQQPYPQQPPPSLSPYNQGANSYTQQYANSGAGQAFTNLAATGAQNFYSGAQTVGNAFGFPQYEAPLFSSAASLFGR